MPSYKRKSVKRRSKRSKRSMKRSKRGSKGKKSRGLKLLSIKKSPKKDKKYVATFSRNGRIKKTHFGASGYQNYGGVGKERHLSEERKKRYIQRHKGKENWRDPTKAGTLSKFVLWNKKSLRASIADYKKRFHL